MLWGGRDTANIYHWHVGSARSVSATLGLPPLTACVLSQPTLLRLQVVLQGAGPGLHALPRSKLLRFRFSGTPQRHRLGCACVLCPSMVGAAQATRFLVRARSLGVMRLITTRVPAARFSGHACLQGAGCFSFWGADLWLWPSQWMSTAQNLRKSWLETGSLFAVW